MNVSKIVEQFEKETESIHGYKTWDIQDLITELVMSGQGKAELYRSFDDISEEEFEELWKGLQALREAVTAALGK